MKDYTQTFLSDLLLRELFLMSPIMKSPGRLWNNCCMKPRRMSSMVFDRIGLNDSDTGRQFSFKYAFVLSSEIIEKLYEAHKYCRLVPTLEEKHCIV